MRLFTRSFLPVLLSSLAIGNSAHAQVINETQRVLSINPCNGCYFGSDVAISDGVVVVGASLENRVALDSGAAYLHTSSGAFLMRLMPTGLVENANFGSSVDIDDGIVAVSAPGQGIAGSIFLFDAATGEELNEIIIQGANRAYAPNRIILHDGYLIAGAYSDHTVAIGAGKVSIYDVATGDLLNELYAPDADEQDGFGIDVAIENGIVAVGAFRDDDGNNNAGAVYLFDFATGDLLHKLIADDAGASDWLGQSISIRDGLLAAGVRLSDISPHPDDSNAGAVYLFDVATGQQIRKIVASDRQGGDMFGTVVLLTNNALLVSAIMFDRPGAEKAGIVYVIDPKTGAEIARMMPETATEEERFSYALAEQNGTYWFGSSVYRGDVFSGAAYIFEATFGCDLDLNQDFSLDFFDVSFFLGAFVASDPIADINGDGTFDFFDISEFINAFAAGCS